MANISTYEVLGVRFGKLGSAADLVIAAPLAADDGDPAAHTDANRIGWYFDRTPAAEKIGIVIMGTESVSVFDDKLQVLGNDVWTTGDFNIADYQPTAEKGIANGYASLDGSGLVPVSQLPFTGLNFKGNWDANTNSPTLTSGVGTTGDWYNVSVAGSTNLDGISDWEVGDKAIFNGTAWEKIDNSEEGKVFADATDPAAGFLDAKVDGVTITVNVGTHQLELIQAGVAINADQVALDTSSFNGILSGADTDVQLAMDTIDDHTHALDDLSDVTLVSGVALTNGVPVTVDSTALGTTHKWLVQIDDGAGSNQSIEVLGAVTGASTEDFTLYPSTSVIPHTIAVTRAAGTTSLEITASGVGFSATVRRVIL